MRSLKIEIITLAAESQNTKETEERPFLLTNALVTDASNGLFLLFFLLDFPANLFFIGFVSHNVPVKIIIAERNVHV